VTAFLLCQSPNGCTSDAYQRVTVAGANLSKVVCTDLMCLSWAKDQLSLDRPGAVLECVPLMQYSTEAVR
jgi:hypothetical protein